jgi:hypothetical protein
MPVSNKISNVEIERIDYEDGNTEIILKTPGKHPIILLKTLTKLLDDLEYAQRFAYLDNPIVYLRPKT